MLVKLFVVDRVVNNLKEMMLKFEPLFMKISQGSMSDNHLKFTAPILWYGGPEGNFLARPKNNIFGFALRSITNDQLKLVADLQRADDQSIQWLIDEKWLYRPTKQQLTQARFAAGISRIHALHQAAYQPNLNTTEYHEKGMDEAFHQFDHVEITSSHLLREPNEILQGLTYAQTLANWMRQHIKTGAKILEIGGGTGVIANQLLTALKDLKVDYTLMDLSPQMQHSQKKQCSAHDNIQFISGNILNHDFSDSQFDFILCNEMIADLPVEVADKKNIRTKQAQTQAEEYILKHKLAWEDAPPKFCINTGAIDFLSVIKNLLANNARALITEYGSHQYPGALNLKGHREHSIHFGHLLTVAKNLDLSSKYVTVGELFNISPKTKVLSLKSTKVLTDVLAPLFGIKMPLLFYTETELKKLWKKRYENIHGLHFHPIGGKKNKLAPSLSPYNFKAMLLQR